MVPLTRAIMIGAVLLALGAGVVAPAVHGSDSEEQKRELRRIKEELAEKKQMLQRTGRRERSILSDLERIDREIEAGSARLEEQERSLRKSESALAGIEQSTASITQELEHLRRFYRTRLRALYKMSRSGGYALAILSADNFATAYRRVRYLSIVAEHDQHMIEQYSAALKLLAEREQEIRERQSEIRSTRKTVQARRLALRSRQRKKTALLGSVQDQKSVYEATIKDLEQSSKNLWEMIRLTERSRNPMTRSASFGGRGTLPWPLHGQVLSRFGKQRHPKFGTIVYRHGIEIGAREGEEVRAVSGGQIVYANWYKGYGRLVIIDHGSDVYSLYGYLSELKVGAGDRVARGQVVGLAGDTGSLKGSRLYFEIRKDGEAEDPLRWLAKR